MTQVSLQTGWLEVPLSGAGGEGRPQGAGGRLQH